MTETLAYIKESLKDLYPPSEISSLVRLIMERVSNIQPHHFLFCKDKVLPEAEKNRIHEIVERLKEMEPIQYILGTADFYSLQFEVNPSVLIPRPETEELVEQVIIDNEGKKIKILDIGTGSGCIAVTLRKHLKQASIIATDISTEALDTARRNAKRNNATITFIQTDILNPEKAEMDIPFILDVIVSNPPYIKEEEKIDMERNVLDYEPHIALFVPDNDPLLYYWHIAHFGKKKLRRNGRLYFEINAAYGSMVVEMLEEEGYKDIELIQDLSGKDRIVKARK
ncbi:peptide chain release factor N(5)-glutamine methyltransferase [Parabacteroides acidifaciens]|uniref:Release factor glutamine methyltransferase n=1 Tax=Parabacteroides acidifaciens TaxID=2290935 RepID=A0A3D8HAP5_9BACT|nr:peptide chain release factor N(5)-glutamine methyltransferase [Parabacteroides acidifaciens]MBC8603441.1 peptide chain release factor N(5)-glutamine methyltransferase [Parabacteroides acidifaciens]RDU47810.1 peptide chain release factor N(5)-glutamine methyltransferase [Parabacteroides acidifaciens]